MSKVTLKTRPNDASVEQFLDAVADAGRREDCRAVMDMMARITGEPAAMWGSSIIGFGSCQLRYASGRELDWMLTGVAPRKQALSVYIMSGFEPHQALLERLGRFKTGKSCLYIKRLEQVDGAVLERLIRDSVAWMRRTHG
jgi:hypothetical protein